jgi:hypothetical protein
MQIFIQKQTKLAEWPSPTKNYNETAELHLSDT